jgi:hypothetical protein
MALPNRPNAPNLHWPTPEYTRALCQATGLSKREIARRLGISDRMLRYYCMAATHPSFRPIPYTEQFALERLCPVADRPLNPRST